MSTPLRRAEAQQGFTLLELLVAITLLALLMTALLGGLRLGARVWETGEKRLDANARVQVVQDFLRQRLAEAQPFEATMPGSGQPQFSFLGAVDEVRFAGNLPEQLGAGVYLMQLTLAEGGEDGRRRDLVLRWQPLDLEGTGQEKPPEPETRVLIEDVTGLDFAYFGALDQREAPAWWPEWSAEQDAFPGLVRVQVHFADDDLRQWPELIVHPMVDRAALF